MTDKHVEVMNELDRRNLQERTDDGNTAHVFGHFLRGYMRGLELRGKMLDDTDAVAVMHLLETARSLTQPMTYNQEMRKLSLAMTRAYFGPGPDRQPEAETPEEIGRRLFNEIVVNHAGGDIRKALTQAFDLPENWTLRECKLFDEYKFAILNKASTQQRDYENKVNPPPPRDNVSDRIYNISPEEPSSFPPLNPGADWQTDELTPHPQDVARAEVSPIMRAIQQGRGPDVYDLAVRQMSQAIVGEGREPKYSRPLPYSDEENKPDSAA